jgi:hypothetical protein
MSTEQQQKEPPYTIWRAAMWWGVGYSNGLSGEELANHLQLDDKYREAYEKGLEHGREVAGR